MLQQALTGSQFREYSEGQVLIAEGTGASGVLILLEGRVGVYTQDAAARITPIRVVTEAGSMLGEQSLRAGRRFANASILALTAVQAAHLPAGLFRDCLDADAGASARIDETGRQQALEKLRLLSAELATTTHWQQTPTPRQWPTGSVVFEPGSPADCVYFVVSGQVALHAPGCPVAHETVGPGLMIGERDVMAGSPRSQRAVAMGCVELLEIPAEILRNTLNQDQATGTNLKALSFVHHLPRLGAAYRFAAEVNGSNCMVTDYSLPEGRRVRVRHFPREQMVEAGSKQAGDDTEMITAAHGRLSLLILRGTQQLVGLRASEDWPNLPAAMSALLRAAVLERWQIEALRNGHWMEENAAQQVQGGSEIVCACTNASVTALRLAAKGCGTPEELMRATGAGTVCGGCRARLPMMMGQDEALLCRLHTEPLCEGAIVARLLPLDNLSLPPAKAGQHVLVEALLDGRWVGRPYTLTNASPQAYELGVKIEEGGLFSNWMSHAPEGCLVRISPPQGSLCPAADDPRALVHVVAGIGVTTAISSLRLLESKRKLLVHLVYRGEHAAPYLPLLRQAEAEGRLQLVCWDSAVRGRPSPAHWQQHLQGLGKAEVLVCGPDSFNDSVIEACRQLPDIEAKAESFHHPRRGEGAIAKPGSWRLPDFKPSCPLHEQVLVKSQLPLTEEAERFLQQYGSETNTCIKQRLVQVKAEIANSGTWLQTQEELGFAARVAWRNAERCVGRLYWRGLHLRDCRHLKSAAEIAEAIFEHLRFAFNGGDLRPAISVFDPGAPGRPGPRIWNPQLLRYAGRLQRTGKQIGDPAQNELTLRIMKLGWQPKGGDFELLPLVIETAEEGPQCFELPEDCRQEVIITHPQHPWLADLGLRWYCVPAVSDMMLDAGGVKYPFIPFNGWYLDAEIAARNFTDGNRYNLLPQVAQCMGLDISNERTLWRDKALLLLNEALLHSFDRDGVKISDHHSIGHEFLEFCRNEQKAGREPYGKWMWLVPPVSSSTSVLYQEPFRDAAIKPAFRYQRAAWEGRPL
jgi:nitric-oxide synthase